MTKGLVNKHSVETGGIIPSGIVHYEWESRANCNSENSPLDPTETRSIFFPDASVRIRGRCQGESSTIQTARELFCDTCPVKQQCLEFALQYRLRGIWGGLTYEERRELTD